MLADMWRYAAEKRRERKEVEALFKIAEAFNKRHTYMHRREWMCPQCNKVHEPTGYSGFTGLHYPKCCDHPQGHRCYTKAATGWN